MLRRARVAVLAYFALLGLGDGVWLARIPAVKQNLHLSDGLLGVALLAAPAGLVAVSAIADRLIDRLGSARLTAAAAIAVSLLPVGFGLAPSLAVLMTALFAFGLAGGLLDVAMNAQAVLVERGYARPLITSFHALFSVGGLAGALLGGAFAWAGVGPAATFTAVGAPLAGLAVLARRGLLRGPEPRGLPGPPPAVLEPAPPKPPGAASWRAASSRAASSRWASSRWASSRAASSRAAFRRSASARIIALGLLALCCLLAEGAAGGWSAVYLRDNLGTSAGFAALGYAAFSVAMAAGRLAGDRLAARFGPAGLLSGCGLVAALGLAAGLASASPVAAVAGFAVFGLGLSSTFPQLVSAAGNVATSRSGTGIARVAGAGYLGLLGGPVLIGTCASVAGLRLALGIPVLLMLFVAAGARTVRGQAPGTGRLPSAARERPGRQGAAGGH